MKGWYRYVVDCAMLPARVTLDQITAERVDFYSYVPPPGGNILVSVEPLPVDDSVPTKDEIDWVVTRLKNHCPGGTSWMRDEHIKGWLE